MYSILVVDDEIISRLGITSLLDWQSVGFEVVDSVANGEEALEIMRASKIDLVITDIKMPVMTGTELIQAASEEGLKSAFIVLSSFDDYEYVREALKMGALDYILKLDLDKDHMLKVLEKAKEHIASVSTGKGAAKGLDKQTLSGARREFLRRLLYGQLSFDEASKNRLDFLQLTLTNEKFLVLMFKVKDLDETLNDDGIRGVIEEILEEYDYAYICDTGRDELSILFNMPGRREQEQFNAIQRLANRVTYIMRQYFNQKVVLYVSQTFDSVEQVPLAYLQVCQTVSLKSVTSDAQVVFYDDVIANRNYMDYSSFEKYIERFEQVVQGKDSEGIENLLEDLLKYVESCKYIDLGQVRYLSSSMIYIANRYLEKYGYQNEGSQDKEEEKYRMLQTITRKQDLIDFLMDMQEKLKVISGDEVDNYNVRKVKKYLKQHYKEGIVLKDVAEHFCLSNTYLSMLFKKETGETLKDYLTGLKIGHAKERLRTTNDQVSEIAKDIGYDNEHYFSRIFKQKTGMTPTGYRNTNNL